jgi:hypothetical protein
VNSSAQIRWGESDTYITYFLEGEGGKGDFTQMTWGESDITYDLKVEEER